MHAAVKYFVGSLRATTGREAMSQDDRSTLFRSMEHSLRMVEAYDSDEDN